MHSIAELFFPTGILLVKPSTHGYKRY